MQADIKEQFSLIAKEYDQNRKLFIPCFTDFYEKTTTFIANSLPPPSSILDLGAGTGLLSSFYFQHFPLANFLLTDITSNMLNIAKKRFLGLKNFSFMVNDYINDFNSLTKEGGNFNLIISALSIHHAEEEEKQRLFTNIFHALSSTNGVFINYDQFCFSDKEVDNMANLHWKNLVTRSGLSKEELDRWQKRAALDRECSIEWQINALKEAGFSRVECVYRSLKFAVIVAMPS